MIRANAAAVDVDGPRFAWREQGEGSLVVLLHGLGGSRLSWEPQLAALRSGHRVVAWDLPGYGASAPLLPPVTFAALAQAAADLIVELGDTSAHVVGISMGGMIAQYLAAWHPQRVDSLTLLSTSPSFGLDGTAPDDWRAARLAPLDAGMEPSEFAHRVLRAIAGPHIADESLAQQRAAMSRITGAALRTSIDCLITHDSRSLLPGVTAPTLCLVGELDEETPPGYSRALVDLLPNSTLRVISGAGHLLNAEAPDIVNELIAAHIATVDAP